MTGIVRSIAAPRVSPGHTAGETNEQEKLMENRLWPYVPLIVAVIVVPIIALVLFLSHPPWTFSGWGEPAFAWACIVLVTIGAVMVLAVLVRRGLAGMWRSPSPPSPPVSRPESDGPPSLS